VDFLRRVAEVALAMLLILVLLPGLLGAAG
jgi:hypothetical protein